MNILPLFTEIEKIDNYTNICELISTSLSLDICETKPFTVDLIIDISKHEFTPAILFHLDCALFNPW